MVNNPFRDDPNPPPNWYITRVEPHRMRGKLRYWDGSYWSQPVTGNDVIAARGQPMELFFDEVEWIEWRYITARLYIAKPVAKWFPGMDMEAAVNNRSKGKR
jgi:hypothetical protein